MTLSVVISAYNEENNLKDCLSSVRWADEIIVVDNESSDSTKAIAEHFTKQVFSKKNNPLELNQSKNFGFTKATSDWILSLDADERVGLDLKNEITNTVQEDKKDVDGYLIPRKNIIF